jgi:hypothetical protein
MKRIGTVLFGVLALAALASAPAFAQFNLDNYKCYKAKDLKNPKFEKTTVDLEDQFGAINDGEFQAKKPFLFCTPVDRDGEGIINAVDHLTCYKVKGPKLNKSDRPTVEVFNDVNETVLNPLGTLRLSVIKPFLLCVPSEKTVLP